MKRVDRRVQPEGVRGWMSGFLITLALFMVVSTPMSASAQAIRGTEFSSDQGGGTVTWTDDWEASLEGDDDFSTMLMLQGEIMIYAVMFVHDPVAGLSMRSVYFSLSDVLVSSFDAAPTQVYEWEESDGSFRGLNVVEISGINFLLYMRVEPGTNGSGPIMQFAGAPLRAFTSSLSAIQAEIAINGAPAMAGDNGDDLLSLLQENEESDSAAAPDSAPTTSGSVLSPERPRVGNGLVPPTSEGSGGEFVSEANDYVVTYGSGWTETNSTIGEFSLASLGRPQTVVSFIGRSTTETNRQAYFEDIVARESRHSGFVGSVMGDERLLIASWSSEDELSILEYVFVDDDTVVTVMVTLTGSNPERGINAVREIELDGTPILQDWDELWSS